MNTNYSKYKSGDGLGALWRSISRGRRINRGAAWGMMILGALVAFEIFNYSTTQFALTDVLGTLEFAGMRWASILAIAFCGIDFAGIARIFTPEQGSAEPKEVWYLFGAWLLAAAFNASLTWWGVSVAIVNHTSAASGAVVSNATLTKVIPIFVSAMVLLIRVLIIGTFSLGGDRLFSTASEHAPRTYQPNSAPATLRPASNMMRPTPKPMGQASFSSPKPEATYHSLGFDSNSRQHE